MSQTIPRPVSSSPPGHQDQSARLAASAPVDQVGGTPTLEQFQRWLEAEAHIANSKYNEVLAGKGMSGKDWSKLTKRLANLRAGFALVAQFKLEKGA